MGIMGEILILFLSGIGLFIAGMVRKSRIMKIASFAALGLSAVLFFAVWNALGYM